ncbi:MAG: Fic family protein [Candidatus Acidiferrales bacterium]
MGRLLIAFLLCSWGVLRRPLLYISDYFGRNRQQYYDRLQAVRDNGDWEGWMTFFLRGVKAVSDQAARPARLIQLMREEHRQLVGRRISRTAIGLSLLNYLFAGPMVTVGSAALVIGRSYTSSRNFLT